MENWKDLPTASLLLHCMCTRESNRVIFFKPQLERAHLLVLNSTLSLLSFINTKWLSHSTITFLVKMHCRRNGSNLFQTTVAAHPGVSGGSKDQKFCEEFKNSHCQVDHPHCNPVQGQYRARTGFSLWSFPHRKNLFSLQGTPVFIAGTPVFITGISLWEKLHKENPLFITGNGIWADSL